MRGASRSAAAQSSRAWDASSPGVYPPLSTSREWCQDLSEAKPGPELAPRSPRVPRYALKKTWIRPSSNPTPTMATEMAIGTTINATHSCQGLIGGSLATASTI